MADHQPSTLRRIWTSLFGPGADEINAAPEDMSQSTRDYLRTRQAKYDFNKATTYPHKVLTRHDRAIIPYRVTANGHSLQSNLIEFASQPRVRELYQQMQPLLSSTRDDVLILDDTTGRFYLKSALDKCGADKARPLGEIDLKTERMLFNHAAQNIAMKRLFGGASHDNPIVMDESGKVYPKNNPSDVRGHVRLGQSVHMGSSRKPRR